MDSGGPGSPLSWSNVLIAFSFIALNAFLSYFFHLGVSSELLIAAVRCVGQLGVVALVLERVFEMDSPWAVAGVCFLLNLLGTFEAVVNKSKRRHLNMFPSVLFSMLGSTIPISIIGTKFAMSVDPFWDPVQYIPVVGMLCGSTINGAVVTISYILKELQENRDRVEMYLAFGASRREACRPIAVDALRIALMPTINQMSVLGIIAIPGMMTGAILGGSSVTQAAKLQMIIMFMISASTGLASISCAGWAIGSVVDGEERVRSDRVFEGSVFGTGGKVGGGVRWVREGGRCLKEGVWRVGKWVRGWGWTGGRSGGGEEVTGLLERGNSYTGNVNVENSVLGRIQ